MFSANDPNHYKFTGKERDQETGLDYFGARYYSNQLGRFITPDWSATPVPVPYADLHDPQSLNQYSYVRNIPTSKADADGHCTVDGEEHGFWWCVGHAVGLQETQKEYHARIADERQQLLNNTRHADGSPLTDAERYRIQHSSETQIDERYQQLKGEAEEREADNAGRRAAGIPPVPGGSTSPNQMQKQVERGQAPKSVDRVDSPRFPNEKPHVEFKDGNALNNDGTWKHGGRELTNTEMDWLRDNGWALPK